MTQFIVQNTSPQRKSVTVFGLSIPYGATANLMQLPNVTENIIADSLLKGELRLRIDNRDLTVTLCTVLIPSADSTFTNYLVSIGLGSSVHPEESKSYLKQDEWYIDPVNGNDNRSGKTEAASIKTWAEFMRRVGLNSTLDPASGLLKIYILNDLPSSDPVTWDFVMAPNCEYRVYGTKTEVATGTITDKLDYSDGYNGWQITDSSKDDNFWEDKVGLFVEITAGAGVGSKAIVSRDMNQAGVPVPKTAHMTEWVYTEDADPVFDWLVFPNTPPSIGDTYKVYSFSSIVISRIEQKMGGLCDISGKPIGAEGDADGVWKHLTLGTNPDNIGPGFALHAAQGFLTFVNCLFSETGNVSWSGGTGDVVYANTAIHGVHAYNNGANVQVIAGGVGKQNVGGAINVGGRGVSLRMGMRTVCSNANINLFGGGRLITGEVSFWDCIEPVFLGGDGGAWFCDLFDGFTGASGYVPYFGTGNDAILMGSGSRLIITQRQDGLVASTPVKPPTCDAVVKAFDFAGVIKDETKFHPFTDFGYIAAVELSDSDYANLAVATPAGFRDYQFDDSGSWGAFRSYHATAHKPQLGIDISFMSHIFEAP